MNKPALGSPSLAARVQDARIGFWREFAICLCVALAARGSMIFTLSLSADDYLGLNYYQFNWGAFVFFAEEMRLFNFLTNYLMHLLGAYFPFVGVLWAVIFNASFVFAGLVLMRIWVPGAASVVTMVGAGLFFLFPYHTDYLRYGVAAPYFSLALFLGVASLYICVRGRVAGVLGILGLAYAISGQVTLVYLLLIVLFEAFIWAFRAVKSSSWCEPGFAGSARPWLLRFGAIVAGVVLYVVINKAVLFAVGIPAGGRLVLSSPDELPEKIIFCAKQMHFFFFKPEVTAPLAVKLIQLTILLFIALAGLQLISHRNFRTIIRAACWFAMIGAVCLSMVLVMLILLPIHGAPFNQRTLSGLGVYWSGVFALAYAVSARYLQTAALAVGLLLSFSYAVNANRQATDHARINQRDRLVASRMVERLCLQPDFENVRTVVLAGAQSTFNTDRISTSTAGFAVSALYRPWSYFAVLREVSGIPFAEPTEGDRNRAEEAAKGKPSWPLPGSVFVSGDLGVVVMPGE